MTTIVITPKVKQSTTGIVRVNVPVKINVEFSAVKL
jgi:hypothetical protein